MKRRWRKWSAILLCCVMGLSGSFSMTAAAQESGENTMETGMEVLAGNLESAEDPSEDLKANDMQEENLSKDPSEGGTQEGNLSENPPANDTSEESFAEESNSSTEKEKDEELEEEPGEDSLEAYAEKNISVKYAAHMQGTGWQAEKSNGQTAGLAGQGKRMEAFKVSLEGASSAELSLEYRAHVAKTGWQSWVSSGEIAGTTGESKAVEAVQFRLTGGLAENYNIYYRVYSKNVGWLGWAKNGEIAGTTGMSCQVEAVEICVLGKSEKAPGSTENHYIAGMWEVSYQQSGETTTVNISPESVKQIVQQNLAESLSVTATMQYNGKVTRTVTKEKTISEISASGFQMDFQTYGKFKVTATFKKNGTTVGTNSQTVGVSASEYNLAPISATAPVTLFSLSLWDIKQKNDGGMLPTIVMLARPLAYDWDALPAGVYAMPYLTQQEIKTTYSYDAFAAYMKDLFEISPKAKFNLYINDIDCDLVHQMIYANRIPEGQYTFTLMSDGSATYSFFNDAYASASPEGKNKEMMAAWNDAKTYAYQNGTAKSGWSHHKHMDYFYAALSCETNAQWWVARTDLFTSGDGNVFANTAAGKATRKNISSMLTDLQNKGDQTVQEFKALYNFNDGYFEKAEAEGKQAMMILGTYVENEKSFEDYARLTKLYYGDEYVYYYKGHPKTPTGMYPSKQAQLKNTDIIDVDSSIAAELILFFNPTIRLSGYGTSTFNSASAEMACGLYEMKKENALTAGGGVDYSGIDWFASPLSGADPVIAALGEKNSTSYLLEFSDEVLENGEYDFAIYNATKNILTYYKENNGQYKAVKKLDDGRRISYSTHVSTYGWQAEVSEGQIAGTVGESKRIEALKINLTTSEYTGNIEYRAYVAKTGWQSWKKNGEMAGTTGKSLAMEAVAIRLTGEMAKQYDIYYRVHSQGFGWLDWAKNGETAGTSDYSKRMEAVEIRLVAKGGKAPGATTMPYKYPTGVFYQSHVQTYGWQNWVENGQLSGTSGQSKRLESIRIQLKNTGISGNIEYKTHVQTYGWEKNWIKNGAMSGTSGQSKRLEAIQIRLTGEMAEKYDVYYRTHAQTYGWLGWAKNGGKAGTEGLSKRLEAIEIKLVPKGETAPGSTDRSFISK